MQGEGTDNQQPPVARTATGESRAAVMAGAGALAVVLLLALWLDPASHHADLAQAVLTPARAEAAIAPAPAAVSAGELAAGEALPLASAPLAEIARDPDRYVGLRFRCRNRVAAQPIDWTPDAGGLLPLLERWGRPVARHRLALSCEARDLQLYPALAFYEMRQDDPAVQVRAGDVLTLTVLGASPTGALLTALERDVLPDVAAAPLQELAPVLARPDAHAGAIVRCRATAAAELREPAALHATTRALFVEATLSEALLAEVRCEQARGTPVAALVRVAREDAAALLAIRSGAELQLRALGAAEQRVVADVVTIDAHEGSRQEVDLREVLLQPERFVGRPIHCVSMGLPLPQPLAEAEAAALPGGTGLAPTKAWVVCRQPDAPPVNLTLRFGRGEVADLLGIGRGTELRAKVLGLSRGQIVAQLQELRDGALDAASRRADLRRFVALRENLVGTRFVCPVLDVEQAPGPAGAERPGAALFSHPVDASPVVVRCADAQRPHRGQAFELYFGSASERLTAVIRPGVRLPLRMVGVVHATPIVGLDDEQRLSASELR